MSQNSTIRKFIDRNVERMLVREFLLSKTERAGFGGLDFQRTPEGTKVTLSAERVGMVIGRKGKIINELQRRLQDDFNIENPRLEVAEIDTPELNAQVMASKLASALERGWYFRRAGHSSLLNIMDKGAKGCLVVLSGKLTGSRNRTQKFQAGHIKYCGDTALQFMDIGKAVCVKKLGTIGCTVAIMRPGSKLPHEITIKSRHEVGLPPLVEAPIVKEVSEDLPEPIVEEVPEGEILEEVIEEEPAAEEAPVEEADSEAESTVGEAVTGEGVIARWNPSDWPESSFQEHITPSGSTEGLTWKCNLTKISEGTPVVILGPKNSENSGIVAIGVAKGPREKKTGLTEGSEETWRIDVSLRSVSLDISTVKEILGDEIEDTVQGSNYLDPDHFTAIEQAIIENTEATE